MDKPTGTSRASRPNRGAPRRAAEAAAPPTDGDEASSPKSRKGAQTRARLLEGAKVVFERDGFLDARISDIADASGLSHGSFYHYFDSKEQIFREVAEIHEAMLAAPAEPGSEDDLGPATTEFEKIRRANRRYLQRYQANGRMMRIIEEVARYDGPVGASRMRRQKHYASRAEEALRRLQKRKLADKAVDPAVAAIALAAMVARFAEVWVVDEWNDLDLDLDAVAEQLTLLWANAIGLVESERPPPQKR